MFKLWTCDTFQMLKEPTTKQKINTGKGMCIFLTSLLGLSFDNKIKKVLVVTNFGRKA